LTLLPADPEDGSVSWCTVQQELFVSNVFKTDFLWSLVHYITFLCKCSVLTITNKVQNYDNNSRNWAQHPTNHCDDYYVTYAHDMWCWTSRSKHAAASRFQPID